mmetsp:Transcript_42875/g.100896  ORF Transcript_42875/g.100896 Transcript_42875/m.100896 type:complete len:262 (+) Transcript_42875:585-1370(+)
MAGSLWSGLTAVEILHLVLEAIVVGVAHAEVGEVDRDTGFAGTRAFDPFREAREVLSPIQGRVDEMTIPIGGAARRHVEKGEGGGAVRSRLHYSPNQGQDRHNGHHSEAQTPPGGAGLSGPGDMQGDPTREKETWVGGQHVSLPDVEVGSDGHDPVHNGGKHDGGGAVQKPRDRVLSVGGGGGLVVWLGICLLVAGWGVHGDEKDHGTQHSKDKCADGCLDRHRVGKEPPPTVCGMQPRKKGIASHRGLDGIAKPIQEGLR